MNLLKHFAKSSVVYFFGNILTKLIIFFLLPLYTKYIPPSDFGYYDLSLAYMNVIIIVVSLEIWSTIMRFMFDKTEQKDKYVPVFNGLVIFAASFIIYGAGAVIVKNAFAVEYLFYIFLYGLFHMVQAIFMFVARGFGKNMLFALSGLVNTAVTVFLNILFILKFNMDFKALYISACIGMFIQICILESCVHILTHLSAKQFDPVLIKNMLKFAIAFCVNSLCYWFMTKYSKYIISVEDGTTGNGLYAIAEKFTVALTMVTSCVSMAWQEVAYFKESSLTEKKSFYTQASDAYIKFLSVGILALLPLVFMVFPHLVHSSYAGSAMLIPSCLLVAAVNIYSSFQGNIFLAKKKTNVIFYSNFASAAVNMVIIRFLYKYAGLNGINISLFIAFLINIIIRTVALKKLDEFRIDYKFTGLFCLLFSAVTLGYYKGTWTVNLVCFICAVCIGLIVLKKYIAIVFAGKFKYGNKS